MHHNSNHEVKIVRPIEANNREMETIREIKPPRNVESAGCVCGFLVILYIAGKREREREIGGGVGWEVRVSRCLWM